MDPWKIVLIWALPGLVLDAIGIQEYWRGRWRVSRATLVAWMFGILLLGPFMLVGIAYWRSRH